tara:strand:+ start:179 stop:523 length:345 start_codon:yes stop_codon:yes gene_type:complete
MASFPTTVAPSYGASKKSAPKVRVAAFGSGYSQRTTMGINQNLKVWSLTWADIEESASDEIETFLDARGGTESFTFTAPNESASSTYICKEWTKTNPHPTLATITASFEEVAEA